MQMTVLDAVNLIRSKIELKPIDESLYRLLGLGDPNDIIDFDYNAWYNETMAGYVQRLDQANKEFIDHSLEWVKDHSITRIRNDYPILKDADIIITWKEKENTNHD